MCVYEEVGANDARALGHPPSPARQAAWASFTSSPGTVPEGGGATKNQPKAEASNTLDLYPLNPEQLDFALVGSQNAHSLPTTT